MGSDILDMVKRAPRYQGKKDYIRILEGKPHTRSQAIKAHCFDCTGFYDGGAQDCGNVTCALYAFMPYREGVEQTEEGTDAVENNDSD